MTSGPCDQLFWPRAIYTNIVHICCIILLFFQPLVNWCSEPIELFVCHIADCEFGFFLGTGKLLCMEIHPYTTTSSTTTTTTPLLCMEIHPSGQISRVEGGVVGVVDRLQNGKSKEKVEGAKFSFYKIGIQMGTAQIVIWAIKARFAYQYIMPFTHDHLHSIIRSKQNRTKKQKARLRCCCFVETSSYCSSPGVVWTNQFSNPENLLCLPEQFSRLFRFQPSSTKHHRLFWR